MGNFKCDNGITASILVRIKRDDSYFYNAQVKQFCESFDPEKVAWIDFGKQDIRGTESITITDHRHCVPAQVHFENKWEMLGYIQGFNTAKAGYTTVFSEFMKKEVSA